MSDRDFNCTVQPFTTRKAAFRKAPNMSTKKPTKPIRSKIPPPVANKTTPFRGVNWYARGECWMVQIQSQEAAALGIKSHLGYYATDEAAAEALRKLKVDVLQGYYFSMPCNGEIFEQLALFKDNRVDLKSGT